MTTALGTLYGVGLGPGDPELITVKALRILRSVPVVYVPVARAGADGLARSILSAHLTGPCPDLVELVFAMRSDRADQEQHWAAHARQIAEGLRAGRDAAFVTEGDQTLYSTFLHVAGAMAVELPEAHLVVVPGVSSVHAAAAAAGVTLADGDERLAVLPALYEGDDLARVLDSFDTVVLLKVAGAIDRVLDVLEEKGLVDRAVCVSRCGLPGEQIIHDVRTLRGARLDYFATLIVRPGSRFKDVILSEAKDPSPGVGGADPSPAGSG